MDVSDAWLVDTNVLVYAHDPRDRRKQDLNPFHPGFDLGWIGAGAGPADC